MVDDKKIKTRIVAAIRRVWFHSSLRREAVKRAKEGAFYRCNKCKGLHEKVQIDHIQPAIDPSIGWVGYDSFITRLLYCGVDNLDALCVSCHKKKTLKEKKTRTKTKKDKKNVEN